MNFFTTLLSENTQPVIFLNINIEDCKQSISKERYDILQRGCSHFTVENLQKIGKEVATSWMVLFQLHFDKLSKLEFKKASATFVDVFGEKSINVIILKELLLPCKKLIRERKDFSSLKRVCAIISPENIEPIEREIVLPWFSVFEEHEQVLDRTSVGNVFNAIHSTCTLDPKEIKKNINIICLNGQVEQLPLALLLTYQLFQEILTPNTFFLSAENTSVTVMRVFQKYLYLKTLPQDQNLAFTPFLVQLLDIARWIGDNRLVLLCQNKFPANGSEQHLKIASDAAIKAEEALQNGNFGEAKQYFLAALKNRSTDFLSHAALGKIAMQKKEYKAAMMHFEMASKYASFRNDFFVCQVQALMGYVKQFENGANKFLESAVQLMKKMLFGENIESQLQVFLQQLRHHVGQDAELVKDLSLSQDINTWHRLVSSKKFQYEHLRQVHTQLREVITIVKRELLCQAETLLQKIPSDLSKGKEQYLLEGEIQYEKGEFERAEGIFEEVKILIDQNSLILSDKERSRLFYNLSKIYLENQDSQKEQDALSDAHYADGEDEAIRRSFMLFDEKGALKYAPGFIEKNPLDIEAHYAYAWALFGQGELDEAKEHFLQADLSTANVNYFLGEIEEKERTYYFKRALKASLLDGLLFTCCQEIANYFLNSGTEEEWVDLVNLFLSLEENPSQTSEILFRLTEKIQDETVRQKAIAKARELDPEGIGSLAAEIQTLSLEPEPDIGELIAGLKREEKLPIEPGKKPKKKKKHGYEIVFGQRKVSLKKMEPSSDMSHEPKHAKVSKKGKSSRNLVNKIDLEKEKNDGLKKNIDHVNELLRKSENKELRPKALLKAKIILKTLIDQYPAEMQINLLLGKCYLEEFKFIKASTCFAYVYQQGLRSSEVLMFHGKALLGEKKCHEAEKKFSKAIKLDRENAEAYVGLISVAEALGDVQAIKRLLAQITQNIPHLLDILVYMAPTLMPYLNASEAKEVRPYFENKIKEGKASFSSYCCLAKLCQEMGDTEVAVGYFEKVLYWENPQEVLNSWREFLTIATYALKRNDMKMAGDVAVQLVGLLEGVQNVEEIGSGLAMVFNDIKNKTLERAEKEKDFEGLEVLLAIVWDFLKSAGQLEQIHIEQIRRIGIELVAKVLEKNTDRAKEAFEFFIYLADQPDINAFSCIKGEKMLIKLLMQGLRTAGSKCIERDKVPKYSKIITLLGSASSGLIDRKK